MGMKHKGLVKLTEECGELIQIVSKKMNSMHSDQHPNGVDSIKFKIEHEMADVVAAITYSSVKLKLDITRIQKLAQAKINSFPKLDNEARITNLIKPKAKRK